MADGSDSQSKQFGTQYLDKLGGQLDKKAPVFNKSLFAGAGDATKNAWDTGTGFATGLNDAGGFGTGQRGAMDSLGGIGGGYADLAGAYEQDAPGYQRLRSKITDDTLTGVGSLFASNGRYGSDIMAEGASKGLGDALAGLDYGNFTNSVNNKYRSLDSQAGVAGQQFGMGQTALGNQQGAIDALGQIGAAKDANSQGALLGQADLYDRKHNAELDRLLKIGSGFGGAATDAANEAPWWQQLLGYAVGNAGKAASAWGG